MKNLLKNNRWLKKLLQNSGWMGMAQGARIIDVLVRSIIVARLLSLDDFAAYAVALAFVGLISELANLNIGAVVLTYGTRYQKSGDNDKLNALFKVGYLITMLAALLAIAVITLLLALIYDVIVEQPDLFGPMVFLGFASTFNLFDAVNKSILRLIDQFRVSCMVDVAMMFVNILVMFAIMINVAPTSANAIYAAGICLMLLGTASTVITFSTLSKIVAGWWQSPIKLLWRGRGAMARMAIGNSLSSSIQRLMRKGDIVLLAALAPAEAVGLYDIGKKLATLVLMARDAVILAAFPQIARAINDQQFAKLRALILKLMMVGIPVAIVTLISFWTFSDEIISLSYGRKYLAAGPTFIVLTVTSIFFVLFFWANALLLNMRRVKVMLLANFCGLVVMAFSALVLVPQLQMIGMAWATVLGTGVQFGIIGWVSHRILGAKLDNDAENGLQN